MGDLRGEKKNMGAHIPFLKINCILKSQLNYNIS